MAGERKLSSKKEHLQHHSHNPPPPPNQPPDHQNPPPQHHLRHNCPLLQPLCHQISPCFVYAALGCDFCQASGWLLKCEAGLVVIPPCIRVAAILHKSEQQGYVEVLTELSHRQKGPPVDLCCLFLSAGSLVLSTTLPSIPKTPAPGASLLVVKAPPLLPLQ